jgi:hypothetical protein
MAIADRALMTTQLRDTRRRAELRGREAVAQWRIKSAVWAGRLYTVMFIALSIVPLLNRGGPNWASAIVMVIIAAGLLFATERMRTGSRAAAISSSVSRSSRSSPIGASRGHRFTRAQFGRSSSSVRS